MLRIGDVWDSTTDVLAGRGGPLAWFAALGLVLPSAVQSAVRLYGGGSTGAAALGFVVGLVAIGLVLWAMLAVIALASDPATTRVDAGRIALSRLPAALLVTLVAIAAVVLLTVPVGIALAVSGYDVAAASAAPDMASMPKVSPGASLFVSLYTLVLAVVGLWVSARLLVLWPVLVVERRKIGAFGRSWRLTRGLALKLIGVTLLFTIVWGVALLAVQSVVGLAFRLLLGAENIVAALLLAAIAGAIVTAAFVVVVQVFATRLHAALTREGARTSV